MNIVLINPEIPFNTGNIGRTCVATNTHLYLVGKLGFKINDREIRRSGLLIAVELGDSAKLYRIMELFKEAGILSDWFLFCDTAFRISPPLTISESEIRESSRLILSCLDQL